ncbi:mannitol 1-phosphate dehydrogenase [Tothia fuscella]|uniref:Mannitol 1-phosphate dehydrogenase n=1 Tax=Tothia fuscella TaxID=1048955 RepID=A0A9P4NXQ6_9PEZI|nr:mannitol 1-phosphate dehydrogenase [Tothia fuscella]
MTVPPEFSRPSTSPFTIAVIGGGIAGLSLTLGLLQHQISVTLYEAASKFGEVGAGVSFGPNASRAMKLISPRIFEGFENRATRNQWEDKSQVWFDFRYGESCGGKRTIGEKIATLECEGGQASVHRAHFLDEMVQLLPDGVAKFGKRCVGYEQDGRHVVLKFSDGSTAEHSAAIGCDGIKSKMRTELLGGDNPASKAVYSGKYAYRGLIPMEKAEKLLGEELAKNSQMYLGNHGHVLTFSIEKGRTMNVVAFSSSEQWEKEDWVVPMKKEDMFRDFEGWGDSVKEILSLTEKPDIWALFNQPHASTYYKGNVCLIGDAAHATTPHQGAGAGMAIEDSYILCNLLAEVKSAKGIEAAFRAYDAVRRPRSQKLVTTSREAGQLYEFELEGSDPEAIRVNLLQRMDWLWKHDLTADLAEAKEILNKSV